MAKHARRSAQAHDDNPVIGYVAALTERSMWCAGEDMIVAISERQMHSYLGVSAGLFRIAAVYLDTLLYGLQMGAAYALDEKAYRRLAPLVRQAGIAVSVETVASETRPELQWVRVQRS